MAILFCGTTRKDFSTSGAQETTTSYLDSNFVGEGVYLDNSEMMGVALPSAKNELWIGWTEHVISVGGSSADGLRFRINGDDGKQIITQDGNNFALNYDVSTTGTNQTGSSPQHLDQALSTNRMNLHVQFDLASSGVVTMWLYRNGGLYYYESASLSSHTSSGMQYIEWRHNTWVDFVISEVIIADEDTRGLRLVPLDADAAGTHSDFTGDYTAFGSAYNDKGALGAANGDRESWSVEAYPGPSNPSGIHSVNVCAQAYHGASGPANLQGFLRVGGTDYDAASQAPDNGQHLNFSWTTNPADSNPWETTDLVTGVEAGVEAVT